MSRCQSRKVCPRKRLKGQVPSIRRARATGGHKLEIVKFAQFQAGHSGADSDRGVGGGQQAGRRNTPIVGGKTVLKVIGRRTVSRIDGAVERGGITGYITGGQSHGGRVLELNRANVHKRAGQTREVALICRKRAGVLNAAAANGGRAGQRRHRWRGAAIIAQRRELRINARENVGERGEVCGRIVNVSPGIRGNNSVDNSLVPAIGIQLNAAATAECDIAGNGALLHVQSAGTAEDGAAAIGGISREGALSHRQGAGIGDAPARLEKAG